MLRALCPMSYVRGGAGFHNPGDDRRLKFNDPLPFGVLPRIVAGRRAVLSPELIEGGAGGQKGGILARRRDQSGAGAHHIHERGEGEIGAGVPAA